MVQTVSDINGKNQNERMKILRISCNQNSNVSDSNAICTHRILSIKTVSKRCKVFALLKFILLFPIEPYSSEKKNAKHHHFVSEFCLIQIQNRIRNISFTHHYIGIADSTTRFLDTRPSDVKSIRQKWTTEPFRALQIFSIQLEGDWAKKRQWEQGHGVPLDAFQLS